MNGYNLVSGDVVTGKRPGEYRWIASIGYMGIKYRKITLADGKPPKVGRIAMCWFSTMGEWAQEYARADEANTVRNAVRGAS